MNPNKQQSLNAIQRFLSKTVEVNKPVKFNQIQSKEEFNSNFKKNNSWAFEKPKTSGQKWNELPQSEQQRRTIDRNNKAGIYSSGKGVGP